MEKEEMINEICHALLNKFFYIDYDPIRKMLNEISLSTLGDILADLK